MTSARLRHGAAPSAPAREYIYAGRALVAKIESGNTLYYHQDQLSNRFVTNSSGGVAEQLGTFPFGEAWYNSTNDKLPFTTYERDAESGNDYAMARYEVNRLGRFLTPDPAAGGTTDPQSMNRYAYVRNDPVNLSDPSGMFIAPQLWYIMQQHGVGMFGSLWNEFDMLEMSARETGWATPSGGPCPFGDCRNPLPVFADADLFTWLNHLAGLGGGPQISVADLKAALKKLFAANPKCAGLLGGETSADNLVDKMNVVDTTAPGFTPPQTDTGTQAMKILKSGLRCDSLDAIWKWRCPKLEWKKLHHIY